MLSLVFLSSCGPWPWALASFSVSKRWQAALASAGRFLRPASAGLRHSATVQRLGNCRAVEVLSASMAIDLNGRDPSPRKRRRKDRIPPGMHVGPASMSLGTVTAVIDSHAYILPPFDAVNGARLLRFQAETGAHPSFTLQLEPEPRCFMDSSSLVDTATFALKDDVCWSRDTLGRPTWEVGGKRYMKGNCPPHIAVQANAYHMEQLLTAMDFTDVAISVLHHHPAWGDLTPLHREAWRRYPHRFRRLVTIPDLVSPPSDMKAALAYIDAELAFGGVIGFQFFTEVFEGEWAGKDMKPIWDHLSERQVAVWFTCLKGNVKQFTAGAEELFRANFDKIVTWCKEYPDTDTVITHGLPWRSYLHADRKGIGPLPKWVFKASECPRLHLQLIIPACVGDVFDFPYKEVNPMIERLAKRIGAKQLLFGTEMPLMERFCTYGQGVRHIAFYCDFLNPEERTQVLGANMRRLIDRADAAPRSEEDSSDRLPSPAAYYNEMALAVRVPAAVGQAVESLQTPCLVIDLDAFEANCSYMNSVMQPLIEKGVLLRPHMKSHKCSALAAIQLKAHGGDVCCGVCCQTVGEAEAMYRGGVRNILLTSVVVDALKAARMVALAAQGAAVTVCVDSTKGLALYREALKAAPRATSLDVMIELGIGLRCGGDSTATDTAVAIAHTVEVSTQFRLRGLHVHARAATVSLEDGLTPKVAAANAVNSHVAALREAGISSRLVISVGGVGATLPLPEKTTGVSQELQCGSYVFRDSTRAVETEIYHDSRRQSLFVLGSVIGVWGRRSDRHCAVDVGSKAIAGCDRAPLVRMPSGATLKYTCLGEENGSLSLTDDGVDEALALATRMQIGPGDCEATFNLHDFVVGVRDDVVEAVYRIDGHGY